METRVELREVQTALNECQSDIIDQLKEFKTSVADDMQQHQQDVYTKLDSKAGTLDVQEQLDTKTDRQALSSGYADRHSLELLQNQVAELAEILTEKCDAKGKLIKDICICLITCLQNYWKLNRNLKMR